MKEEELRSRVIEKIASRRDLPGIHVTTLAGECLRRGYYTWLYGDGFYNMDSLLRFWIGKGIHSLPFLKESEVPVSWEGVSGNIDEYEEGTILEKKHTAKSIPMNLPPQYVRQVEYYKVLAEKTGKKVDNAYVLYVDVVKPATELFLVPCRDSKTIEAEMLSRRDILQYAMDNKTPPKRVIGWNCKRCDFCSICFYKEEPRIVESPLMKELSKLYGKRFDEARELLTKEGDSRVTSLVITEPLELSCEIKGKSGNYAVFMSSEKRFCSCADYQTKKVVCKHQLYALLVALKQGKLQELEVSKLLEVSK